MPSASSSSEQWSRPLSLVTGGLAVVLGVVVLAGWYGQHDHLTRIHPTFAAMQPGTALSFVLAGLGVACLGRGRFKSAAVLAGAVLTLGLVELARYGLGDGLPAWVPHVPCMAPGTALALIGTGSCMLLLAVRVPGPRRQAAAGVCAAAVVAVGAASMLGYLTGTAAAAGASPYPRLALHTAGGLLLLGAGVLALAWQPGGAARSPGWLPLALAAALLSSTLVLWQLVAGADYNRVSHLLGLDADQLRQTIQTRVPTAGPYLGQLTWDWMTRGKPTEAEWRAVAASSVRANPGCLAIAWINPAFRAEWFEPAAWEPGLASLDFASPGPTRELLERARDGRRIVLSHPLAQPGDDPLVLAVLPIYRGSRFEGFTCGVYGIYRHLDRLLRDTAPGYALALYDGDEELYRRVDPAQEYALDRPQERTVSFYGVSWRFRAWPSVRLLARERSPFPPTLLVGGLLAAGVLPLLVRFAQVAHVRACDAEAANRALRTQIAERTRAEEALRRSEERYRCLVEHAADALFVLTPEGRIVDVNRRACTSLGYTREELLALSMRDLEVARDVVSTCRPRSRSTITVETTQRRKDGSTLPVEVRLAAFETDGQQLRLALVRDITERKKASEALRKSEERYRTVAENSLQGICILQEGIIQYANRRLAAIFGHDDPAALVGTCRDALVAVEYRPLLRARGAACLRGEPLEAPVQWEGIRKDGQRIWIESSATRIEWDNTPALLSFVVDLTERKQLEERLRHTQKMEAIGRLTGGVAHDFNNLLTIINGFCDLLLERLERGDPRHAFAQEVRRAGERAASLTRQLLAYSRKQVLQPVVLSLNQLVASMERMLRRLIGEHIELVTTLDPALPPVLADPGQLEQVLMNLVVNARDAMPDGGQLRITTTVAFLSEDDVRTRPQVRPGPYVRLDVADTGCGMGPETLAQLFEPFFTTKEMGKGTGLGLATVYGIVHQSDGYIEVDSTPGQGSTFTVYLPFAPDGASQHEGPADLAPPRGDETILLVEDEAAVRAVVRQALVVLGYTVLEAENARAAVAACAAHVTGIDLLITDVILPGVSGVELARDLLALHPGLRVLYISGYTGDALGRHAVLEQKAAFLQKPFTPVQLAQKVREVLDERGSAAARVAELSGR